MRLVLSVTGLLGPLPRCHSCCRWPSAPTSDGRYQRQRHAAASAPGGVRVHRRRHTRGRATLDAARGAVNLKKLTESKRPYGDLWNVVQKRG
jgi:hypothetical protein